MKKIMIVEDQKSIRIELKTFLEKNGYEVIAPGTFDKTVEDVLDCKPDLVLLDLNLPFNDGHFVCRQIRKKSKIPIIVVTVQNTEMDELLSMELGADDFVTKPYNSKILLARIQAVLKRANPKMEDILFLRDVKLDKISGKVSFRGKSLELRKNELLLFSLLMEAQGGIVNREKMMNHLWQTDEFVDDNTLTVNMNRLRKTLSEIGLEDFIVTRRGLGYQVRVEE